LVTPERSRRIRATKIDKQNSGVLKIKVDKFSQPVVPVIRAQLLLTTVVKLSNQGTLQDLGVISPGLLFWLLFACPDERSIFGGEAKK
jgi:hypothetical protein